MTIKKIISQFNIPIKEIIIEDNLWNKADNLLADLGFSSHQKLLVTDQNIYSQAQVIAKHLKCPTLVLDSPSPDEDNIAKIIDRGKDYQLIIAAGSGTINDLCKISSFRLKIPYIVFGSAASMNGYASANASIITKKYKTSLPALLPQAIYLDLNILKSAPSRLARAGIGDMMCFSTCQFDWLLSHLLLGTEYNQDVFDLLKPQLKKLLDNDLDIGLLAEILIISGLTMYICGGSYPASQAEHLIAHYLEIKYPKITKKSYHGEQIAVTTLTVAQIQEQILQIKQLQIKPQTIKIEYLKKLFSDDLAEHFGQEVRNKTIDDDRALIINNILQQNWQRIKIQLQKAFVSKNDLLKYYQRFCLPTTPLEIDIDKDIYDQACDNAYLIRNRFTSLDLIKNI